MFHNSLISISNLQIQKDPGVIVGPVTSVLRPILDTTFNMVSSTGGLAFGLAIILFTFLVRILMIPLAMKQFKSMAKMQALQPEMEKIKNKYGNKKDPEVQQKMNAEIQTLYATHKVNPLTGCLPLLVQLPIFIALNHMTQHSYKFVSHIGRMYEELGSKTLEIMRDVPGFSEALFPLVFPKVPNGMAIDYSQLTDLLKVFNTFRIEDWNNFLAIVPAEFQADFIEMLTRKDDLEHFFGINLVENSGYVLPGVIIPILCAVTSFLTTYLMNKKSTLTGPQAEMQRKMLLYVMPPLMGWFTISFPAGVGLYWISSSVFQIFQQLYINSLKPTALPVNDGIVDLQKKK